MIIITSRGNGIVCVIPAYNEEIAIGSVVLETRKQCEHVIVVNDGSSDRTSEIASLAGAEVIDMPVNSGKAAALMTGLRQADNNGFKAFVMLDGDGQHDPREIGSLADCVLRGEADLVIGSRFLNGNRNIPAYRKAGQKVLNGLTNAASNLEITDSQSGFRAMNASALENLDFYSSGYNIESDMICKFSERGLKVKEVPITSIYEVPNTHKKHPLTHGLSVMGRIISMISQNKPLLLIGAPGFVLLCAGLFFGLFSLSEAVLFGWGWMFQTFIAVFLFTLGFVMCICALVLNSLSDLLRGIRGHTDKQMATLYALENLRGTTTEVKVENISGQDTNN